jgi:ubiquinone/menaquinone biosynthesis C-methylase UbiE
MAEPRFDARPGLRRTTSPWWGIHEARYRFALNFIAGDKALDVACGTGYGLPILCRAVRYAIGIDVDHGALRSACEELQGFSGSVALADGCRLPFGDRTFDSITSFETIEHLEDGRSFVAELARVLTPGGICIVSTPNANYTRPQNGIPRNPYHIYEYTPSEFLDLLASRFGSVDLVGQCLSPAFTISPFWDDQQRLRTKRELSRLLVWRLLNRMPHRVREAVSRILWGHPFTPSCVDYEFIAFPVEDAPTQLAICRATSNE